MKKVVVIGLDGFEPKIVEAMIQAGDLPNLKMLKDRGGYARLKTTPSAQTPVAWSTFATGTNPGGHGIFDFLSRDPKTYLPELALSRYEQKNAFVAPKVVNMRRGTAIWNVLTDAGLPSIVIRCPCTYPPEEIKGRMLSGVGVPDLRGGLGTSTFYTTREGIIAEHSEKVIRVNVGPDGVVKTYLVGPRNPKSNSDFQFDITLQIDPARRKVILRSEGQPNMLEIEEHKWSDWLKIRFKVGMFQNVRGMLRFFFPSLEPFEFYASAINFDPEAPMFPISSPPEYAGEIQARLGTFHTLGMAEDHDGLNNERFDEAAYIDQCHVVMQERERMMLAELNRFREGFFFCLYDTPDRFQHMFWRFQEDDHPANREAFSPEMKAAIQDHYRACDRVIGNASKFVDDQTLFIVLSDHGMNSFQRGLNLNTWLYENGFMALKNGFRPGGDNEDFFHNVDWSRTQAYALGLGGIFLNRKGREEQGIIPESEVGTVESALVKGLTGLPDPERGKVAVRSVARREQIYSGPYADESPDLVVNFSEGYRVSWGTPLGGVPEGIFEDNVKKWGGDHVIDPALVPGVLFMSQPFHRENPDLVDLAPTILSALGVPKTSGMEGESLLS